MPLRVLGRLASYVTLLVLLFFAPLAYSQQVNECRRDCRSDYWRGVNRCYKANTAYNQIAPCRDALQWDKRKCTRRCTRPSRPEAADCKRQCDRDYWESRSACYQLSSRYREIRECDSAAQKTKKNCAKGCPKSKQPTGVQTFLTR